MSTSPGPRVVLLLLAGVGAGSSAGHRHKDTIVASSAAIVSGSPDPSSHNATLHTLSGNNLATCLDGSPGAYYFKPGAEHAKFLIFHEGGGSCTSIEACTSRAATSLGSSASYPATASLADIEVGGTYGVVAPYFNPDAGANPLFHNWSHVYVKYCDGSLYASDRVLPVAGSDGSTLFFRGRQITEALIADLRMRHGLGAATDVVIGGCSAGGAHVVTHLDRVRSLLPAGAKVAGFSDSGFPLWSAARRDHSYTFYLAADGHNASWMLSQRCLADNRGDPVRCFTPENLALHTATPMFLFQSEYDLANLRDPDMCDPSCESHPPCVNAVGANMTLVVKTTLLGEHAATSSHAAFIDSCTRHCEFGVHPGWMAPRVNGWTPMHAVAGWYTGSAGSRRLWAQNQPFPCDHCCNTTVQQSP